ncbi:MAG: phosphoadenylyl-sulfate reductase [Myxococcota bacterium]
MRVIMVKKRLADGSTCRKCAQTEEMLRRRGVWERVDEVVWALEGEPESPGMKLAQEHDVSLAPFFIVTDGDGRDKIYTSALKLHRSVLSHLETPPEPKDEHPLAEAARLVAGMEPLEAVRWTLEQYGPDTTIAFSGAEDVVLVDMAVRTGLPFHCFVLDTGRLHEETLRFVEDVRDHYGVKVEVMNPDPEALQTFVRDKGLFSFYRDGHHECCGIRKVEPLGRALAGRPAWITGQRRDQSPTRAEVAVLQADPKFSTPERTLVKVNPLAEWSQERVWAYIREHDVPYNPLHEQGYTSIGCAPCTRPTHPGQHPREGRWWWEDATKRECGLHLPRSEDDRG